MKTDETIPSQPDSLGPKPNLAKSSAIAIHNSAIKGIREIEVLQIDPIKSSQADSIRLIWTRPNKIPIGPIR